MCCTIYHQFFLQNVAKGQRKTRLWSTNDSFSLGIKFKFLSSPYKLTLHGLASASSYHSSSPAFPKILYCVWHFLPLGKFFHLPWTHQPSHLCLVLNSECTSDSPKKLPKKKKKGATTDTTRIQFFTRTPPVILIKPIWELPLCNPSLVFQSWITFFPTSQDFVYASIRALTTMLGGAMMSPTSSTHMLHPKQFWVC